MTRAEMRTMLRRRIDDAATTGQRFTNADCDDELNKAARFIAREIAKHQGKLNYPNATEVVTADGTNKRFALSATNIVRVWKAVRTDTTDPEPCRQIDERDEGDYADGSGFDQAGRLLYYLRRHTDGTYRLGFPIVHKADLEVTLDFVIRLTELATGSGAGKDDASFTLIPEDYHELVVQRVVIILLTADDAKYDQQMFIYRELLAEMVQNISTQTEPAALVDELGWN